jgi:outer membrane protein assembly factor BamA
LQAQNDLTLKIIRNDPASTLKRLNYRKKFNDMTSRKTELNSILQFLFDKAFLEARFDSINADSLHQTAFLYTGKRYIINKLVYSEASDSVLEQCSFRPGRYNGILFTEDKVRQILDAPVSSLENNGYPFAKAQLDSLTMNGGEVNALIIVEPGNRISIDSLLRKGNIRISRNYMYRYLGIRPGDEYNESRIKRIHKRLQDLPFATVIKPFEVAYWKDKAKIILYLNKRKASNFSGILGLLPNARVPGKVMITGDVKLHLLNSFAQGELIDINWRSLEAGTQDLKAHLNYPYIFTTPFGVDYEFYLYKKDTSYLTMKNKIGLQYLFSSYNYLQAYADIFSSDLINASGLENVTVLPDNADIRKTMYGLELHTENLDYRMNPRRGFRIKADIAGGQKVIKKNDKINPIVYDSLKLKTGQLQALTDAEWFIPILRRHTTLLEFRGGYLWNDKLFEKELFRLGGVNSLRGFDEESLRASLYGMFLIEYRYLFERNSFLSLFLNGAYLDRKTLNNYSASRLYGFGAGLSFETRIGIFSIYYALGSQNGNPIYFKQSKIHFGINTFF